MSILSILRTADIVKALKQELLAGRSVFDWCFISSGLVVQIVVFIIQPQSTLSFVSALAGIMSVVLCAQGKITTFFFGFIQVVTYLILAFEQHLYAEVAQNFYYFFTMIYGIYVWLRRYRITDKGSTQLQTRHLKVSIWILAIVVITTISVITGYMLDTFTDDSQPYLDAFTTVPAVFAQILMILGYREQWIIWFLIDIGLTAIWVRAGDYCLTAQHIFWCANCIYGYVNWTKKEDFSSF